MIVSNLLISVVLVGFLPRLLGCVASSSLLSRIRFLDFEVKAWLDVGDPGCAGRCLGVLLRSTRDAREASTVVSGSSDGTFSNVLSFVSLSSYSLPLHSSYGGCDVDGDGAVGLSIAEISASICELSGKSDDLLALASFAHYSSSLGENLIKLISITILIDEDVKTSRLHCVHSLIREA